MTTTSRRISEATKVSKPSHTPGIKKGGYCVRPKDFALATKGNPYKGAGMKGATAGAYQRIWGRYAAAKGNV